MGKICLDTDVPSLEWDEIVGVTRTFTAIEYANWTDAISDLLVFVDCPQFIGNLRRHLVTPEQVSDYNGLITYRITVVWDQWTPHVADKEFINGSIQTQHSTQFVSYAYLSAWAHDPTLPLPPLSNQTADVTVGERVGTGGLINDGVGIDADFRILGFTIRRLYNKGTITVGLIQGLMFGYVNKPNLTPWRGFGPGTVKIASIDFNDEDPKWDEISFTFACRETSYNIRRGLVVIPEVRGWDYIKDEAGYAINPETGKMEFSMGGYSEVHQLLPYAELNNVI